MELAQIVRLLDYNKILRFLEMIRDKSQLNLLLQNIINTLNNYNGSTDLKDDIENQTGGIQ